jgi:hypothetical protein
MPDARSQVSTSRHGAPGALFARRRSGSKSSATCMSQPGSPQAQLHIYRRPQSSRPGTDSVDHFMMYHPRLLVAFLSLLKLSTSTCYLPNGTAHDDEGTQPCSFDNANPLHTTCCHGKWGNSPGGDIKFGTTKDECLPNGLCQNRGMSTVVGQEQAPWTHFYRVYCTNSDWSGCLSVCDTGVCSLPISIKYCIDSRKVKCGRCCAANTM